MSTTSPNAVQPDAVISDAVREVIVAPAPGEPRERSIPIRVADLTRLLLAEPGLTSDDRAQFLQLSRMISSILHFEFHARLHEMKELYAPLDPDSDCVALDRHSPALTAGVDEEFLEAFESTLARANYRPLELGALQEAITTPNEIGLNYIPDFNLFEHLKVYIRGRAVVEREARNLKTKFRKRVLRYDAYQRLIIALKFKPNDDLGALARSDVLYLRLYKDVPHVDMEMHLPEQGTKIQMRWIDKAQIASPIATGLPMLAFKLLVGSLSPYALPVLIAPITAGVNSFFGFQRAKQKHLSYMIRHLYYLTLANNSSVIDYLIDTAEEEEAKEALLSYFFLWHPPDELWKRDRLDNRVEDFLTQKANIATNFEVGDALDKLERPLGLIRRDPQDQLHAAPIDRALANLDRQWDSYFRFT